MVMKGSGAQEGDASCMAGLCIAAAPPNRGQGSKCMSIIGRGRMRAMATTYRQGWHAQDVAQRAHNSPARTR